MATPAKGTTPSTAAAVTPAAGVQHPMRENQGRRLADGRLERGMARLRETRAQRKSKPSTLS